MKVKVTIENLENGTKVSQIGDGATAYVKVGEENHILSLGQYNSMEAISNIAYAAVRSASQRHPRGAAGVYDDIINTLKADSAALAGKIGAELTPEEIEKRLVDAIRGAFKDEA